jgi:hypothetical protein
VISKSKYLFNVQVHVTLCFCFWSDLRVFTKSSHYRALPVGTLLSPNYPSYHTDGFPSLDNVQLILSLYHWNSIHWHFCLKTRFDSFHREGAKKAENSPESSCSLSAESQALMLLYRPRHSFVHVSIRSLIHDNKACC